MSLPFYMISSFWLLTVTYFIKLLSQLEVLTSPHFQFIMTTKLQVSSVYAFLYVTKHSVKSSKAVSKKF